MAEANLEEDGTCWLFDDLDQIRVAEWPSLTAWAAAWIDEWSSEDYDLASDFANAMTEEPATWAVDALIVLCKEASSDELGLVGAGPLEDLVNHDGHGELVLDEVEAAAGRELSFRRALSNVWLSDGVADHVRQRLAALGARDFVAEHAMNEDELAAYSEYRDSKGWGWG